MKIAIAQSRIVSAHCKKNFEEIKKQTINAKNNNADLIIFPEMALPGYFNGDTWEQTSFLKECENYHNEIAKLAKNIDIIFGSVGIDWTKKNEDGRVRKYNAVYWASNGELKQNSKTLQYFWIKSLTPNYREFDDSRHFYDLRKLAQEKNCLPENLYEPIKYKIGKTKINIGITVCEDGWSSDYGFSPFDSFSKKYKHDFFVNLSSSPFTKEKRSKRERLFSSISQKIKTPILYVNCVGVQNVGKTIYGFDGSSALYLNTGDVIALGKFFKESLFFIDYNTDEKKFKIKKQEEKKEQSAVEEMRVSLEYILKGCIEEWGIQRIVIGASGGIDSALSAVLCSRALGAQNVYLINMPSRFNSSLTINAAQKLAKNLGCPYTSVNIENSIMHTKKQLEDIVFENSNTTLNLSSLVFENIQARDRGGRILSSIAASLGAVFTCNANKTELTVGYSTLYGDQAGFLCPIADLWKHDIYQLAAHYNKNIYKKEIIPKETIEVTPSAELSDEQNVMENKGDPINYPYHDFLFKAWVEDWNRKTPEDCLQAYLAGNLDKLIGCNKGFSKKLFPLTKNFVKDLERWWTFYRGMGAFKRMQAPPIVAITRRAFGFDHREHVGKVIFSSSYLLMKEKLMKETQ